MTEEATGPYFSTESASRYLDIPVSTLIDFRQKGTGPRWFKIGKRLVRYAKADLDAFARGSNPATLRHVERTKVGAVTRTVIEEIGE